MSYKKFGNNISQEQIIAYIKATYIQQNFSSPAQQIGGTKHAVWFTWILYWLTIDLNILTIKNIAKHPFDNKQGCLIQYLYNLVQLDLVLMWIWMKSETTTFELDLVEQPVFYTYQNLINWQNIKFCDILQKLWQKKNNDIESQKDMNLMLL